MKQRYIVVRPNFAVRDEDGGVVIGGKAGTVVEMTPALAATLGDRVRPEASAGPAAPAATAGQYAGGSDVPIAGDAEAGEDHPLYAMNAGDAAMVAAVADTVEQLDALLEVESRHPRHPGGRKGVLKAIQVRRAALGG